MKKLPKYSEIGSYPLFYLSKNEEILCAKCAQREKLTVNDAHANWEITDLYCNECDVTIEAAYI